MAHRDRKQPKAAFSPNVEKAVRTSALPIDYYKMNPSWQVGSIEWAAPWGWCSTDLATIQKIQDRLKCFEGMTWHEIIGKKNHAIPTAKLCKRARDRLVELGLDDVDRLYSLRITQAERVWGILHQSTLRILWWDPCHEVYPVNVANN